jgi:hypothetical protein
MIKEINPKNFPPLHHNVFELHHTDKYNCEVVEFTASLKKLTLMLIGGIGHNYKVLFRGVRYFQGPMFWKGADFYTSSMEELTELIYRIKYPEKIDAEAKGYMETFSTNIPIRLFIVDTMKLQIKIVASRIEIEKETAV